MPRSPSTRVRRTLVGESQSTIELKLTPLVSAPLISTRSSCGRPMRFCVWPESDAIGEPPSQRTRSRSCVARSLTTPTSRIRSGKGPTRSVAIRNSSPSCPSLTRARSSISAGLQRSTWPTAPWTPAAATISINSRPAAALAAIGFSTKTLAPPAVTSRTALTCSSVGTATIAKSSGPVARRSATD